MDLIDSLSATFQVTHFDVLLIGFFLVVSMILYYFLSLDRLFEAVFGALVGIAIYILLSVLLLGDPYLGATG